MCMKLKVTLPNSISAGLKGMISRGIAALEINEAGHLIVTLTDKSKADLGDVVGGDGVSCTHEWIGTVLRVTSASGTSEADLKGDPGYTPRKGIDYTDGFSPTITATAIAGGHRLTITDATHTFTIDVMDGTGGSGLGDMKAAIYDPQGKAQDIFAYVDNLLKSVVSQSDLQKAIDTALAQAKASGEFDGHTPQKGTDYWTADDKAEIVAEVLAELPATSELPAAEEVSV